MHKNSHDKMEWFKNTYLNKSSKLEILDVGSLDGKGDYNYSDIFDEENWTYAGLDYQAGNNVDIVVTDIYNWFEVEDNTYDVVISGQIFEHLEFFWLTMSQIERVLRPEDMSASLLHQQDQNMEEICLTVTDSMKTD